MPDCDYCESYIEDSNDDEEQPYLTHLAEEHVDEVSTVDERKLEKKWDGNLDKMRGDNYRFKPITIGASAAVVALIIGIGVVAAMGGPSAGGDTSDDGTKWIYEHGQMAVESGGEPVPATELNGTEYFYVENQTGEWRMSVPEDYRYTVGDALNAVGVLTDPESPTAVNKKYAPNATDAEVSVTVDGDSVELSKMVKQGQNITVRIEETEESQ
jgi:hypothetical protein